MNVCRPLLSLAPPPSLTDDEVRALGEGDAVVRDAVWPSEVVADVRTAALALHAEGTLRPAGIGADATHRPDVRGDHIAWVGDLDDGPWPAVGAWFAALRAAVHQATWMSLPSQEVQVAVYPGGGARYARHRDALANTDHRRITAIVYLNPSWVPDDGGALTVWASDGPREVAPVGGRLVLFRADGPLHAVGPAQAPRAAVTSWFRGPTPAVVRVST